MSQRIEFPSALVTLFFLETFGISGCLSIEKIWFLFMYETPQRLSSNGKGVGVLPSTAEAGVKICNFRVGT